jgi:hypothetical protein
MRRMTQASADANIPTAQQLADLVRRHIPDAAVEVGLFSGDDRHRLRARAAWHNTRWCMPLSASTCASASTPWP